MSLVPGSTDVGDVSWVVPTVECATATWAAGTVSHSWQAVAQGCTPAAHRAMTRAAEIMAGTGLELILKPALLEQAGHEHMRRLDGRSYVSPLPDVSRGAMRGNL